MSSPRLLKILAVSAATCVLAAGTMLPADAARHGHGHRAHHKHSSKAHFNHKHRWHHRHKAAPKTQSPAPDPTPAPSDDSIYGPPPVRPTNAAKLFQWGNASLKDEFHGPLASNWLVKGGEPGMVRNQNGMLTLNTTSKSGTVTADWQAGARQYGRWEARMRTRQYDKTGTPYRAVWELIPTSGEECKRSIVLSDSTIGQDPATMHLRNNGVDFSMTKLLDLRQDLFHTYAIEVTPDRISWFINTKVVMSEKRDAARTGESYNVRFRMAAPPGARMNQGRMQMDWVRYYNLDRKNAQSVAAPQAEMSSSDGTC
ncbi:MAG: family 16 glycosylhydrolase [Marmoricola sp.]